MAPGPVSAAESGVNVTTKRVVNFAAGPSQLPESVLRKAQSEMLNYADSGCGVMELSHRGGVFKSIITEAEQNLRDLLQVPDNYRILFVQGGASGQFAAIPLNLAGEAGTADYIVTGRWSAAAAKEAEKYCRVNYVAPGSETKWVTPVRQDNWSYTPHASYVYYCDNETVDGIEFAEPPAGAPEGSILVADMSSNMLSRKFDVSKFGMVFGGAQKNMGPAGVTIVIIRDDILGRAVAACPSIFNYELMAKNASLYNTPPAYAVYITGLVYKWAVDNGGLDRMEQMAAEKSKAMYDLIDSSGGFYTCPIEKGCRSRMNIVFKLSEGPAAEKKFTEEAAKEGLVNLSGHRSIGGLRASIYNAVSPAETARLLSFMRNFALKFYGKQV